MWTELIIHAPPSLVRSIFVDFDNRPNWDPFYRKIELSRGSLSLEGICSSPDSDGHCDDYSNGSSKSLKSVLLSMTVSPKCNEQKFKVPFPFTILGNGPEVVAWGVNFLWGCCFQVDHVHLFLPIEIKEERHDSEPGNSASAVTATRLVNYERQCGPMKYFTDTTLYNRAFDCSNEALKKVCEEKALWQQQ